MPTSGEQARLGRSRSASSAPARTIHSARARSISFRATRDTLYRIHGTNQPEYIGQAISSGCIRMTNADVIDLFNRVKPGTTVVVLPFSQSISSGPSLFGDRRT